MHIQIYVFTHTHTHIYTYTHSYIYVYIYVFTHTHIYVYMHTDIAHIFNVYLEIINHCNFGNLKNQLCSLVNWQKNQRGHDCA